MEEDVTTDFTPTASPMDTNDGSAEEGSYDCRLCPPERGLLYPHRVLFAYNEQTCGEVEEAASLLSSETDCWNLLDDSRALSDCACRRLSGDGSGSQGEGGSSSGPNNDGNAVIDVPTSGTCQWVSRGTMMMQLLLLMGI